MLLHYEHAKILLNLDSLEEWRHILWLKFAKKGNKKNNLRDLFLENEKNTQDINKISEKKYKVQHANTEDKKNNVKMFNHDARM